jgi:hypothetical protein
LFLSQPIFAGDKNEHTKMVVLVVSITVPAILVMAITYIYITKANYKSKFAIGPFISSITKYLYN